MRVKSLHFQPFYKKGNINISQIRWSSLGKNVALVRLSLSSVHFNERKNSKQGKRREKENIEGHSLVYKQLSLMASTDEQMNTVIKYT